MTNNDSKTQYEILDTVKQLKANGSFDQFRKDCFSDIITLPEYQELTKQVEDYVIRFLKDQKPNSKKSLIRDKLRLSLNESYFLTQRINKLIEEILEPKLKSTLKPIINNMVTSTATSISSTITTTMTPGMLCREISSEAPLEIDSNIKALVQKVSIEDFIPNEKNKLKLNNNHHVSAYKTKNGKIIEKTHFQKEKLDNKSSVQKKNCNNEAKVKNFFTNDLKAETSKRCLNLSEVTLERDPTNEYRFNWNLNNQFDKEDYNELSISSAESNELSDLE